jgi:predicted MFS family arabinose efflux permease
VTLDAVAPLAVKTEASAVPDTSRALPRPLIALFAVACGLSVANVYFAHPVLDAIAMSFGISQATAGIVITVTQIGYGVGLVLLVPLGDVLDRRKLIVTHVVLSAAALTLVGSARSTVVLLAGMVAVGVLAVVTQVLVAFAATLADEHERGAVVGTVTSGVVIGILLARTFAGAVTDVAGWRAVYLVSAVLTLTVGGLLARFLPRLPRPARRVGYPRLLRSMLTLYVTEPALRLRAGLAMLIFAAFNVLWASLLLPLREPPRSMSHGAIGLLGLVGAAGAVGAARAGRLADRGLGRITTGIALALLLLSWLPIALVRHSLLALVVGLIVLDLAVQAVHVTSQSIIYRIDPTARSRLVGAYMVFYSIGSAAGAVASTALYAVAGWTGVCLLGAAISAAALTLWAIAERVESRSTEPSRGQEQAGCRRGTTASGV